MSEALYRKWRPKTWDQVIGQAPVVTTLRNALAAGRVSHAYLFAGPRGTGKTTTARLLARAINCLGPKPADRPCGECEPCQAILNGGFLDVIEIDAASNTSVEDVRDLRDKVGYLPNQGVKKIYIIDEVHMLSNAAFNALLKTLEEPPEHVIFILATTEIHKVPPTVLSRCQRHEFRRISTKEIVGALQKLADTEGIRVTPDALQAIARQSTGAMRDAISLLDQLASSGVEITLEMAQDVLGTATSQAVVDIVQALITGEVRTGLDTLHAALDAGSDPRQLARQLVDYLRELLLMRTNNGDHVDATPDRRARMGAQAAAFESIGDLLRLVRIFNAAAMNDSRGTWQPSLPLEMAFVEAAAPTRQPSVEMPKHAPRVAPEPQKAENSTLHSPRPVDERSSAASAPAGDRTEGGAPPDPADAQTNRRLVENWQRFLDQARRHSQPIYGALNSCTAKALRGSTLVITFASEVVKSKVDRPEVVEMLQGVLQEVFGRELNIRFQVDTARRDTVPPGVDQDGIVATAMRDLGGELVDIN